MVTHATEPFRKRNGADVASAALAAELAKDPEIRATLVKASLRYSRPTDRGLCRVGTPDAFRYVDADGHRVRNTDTLARIRALAIPPAWTSVWICEDPQGHLQATGRDARGRLQYRYHPQWRAQRDEHRMPSDVLRSRPMRHRGPHAFASCSPSWVSGPVNQLGGMNGWPKRRNNAA